MGVVKCRIKSLSIALGNVILVNLGGTNISLGGIVIAPYPPVDM